MSNRHPNGDVTLKLTILGRSREKQKRRLSCQRLNAMKMSECGSCLQKVFSNKGIFLILMFVSNAKLYMVTEISCNLIRFKIIRERLAPTCSMGDRCSAFCKETVSYPFNLKSHLASWGLSGILGILSSRAASTGLLPLWYSLGHLQHYWRIQFRVTTSTIFDSEMTMTHVIRAAPAMSFAKFQFVDGEWKSEPLIKPPQRTTPCIPLRPP